VAFVGRVMQLKIAGPTRPAVTVVSQDILQKFAMPRMVRDARIMVRMLLVMLMMVLPISVRTIEMTTLQDSYDNVSYHMFLYNGETD
jgi:hypothetical protein